MTGEPGYGKVVRRSVGAFLLIMETEGYVSVTWLLDLLNSGFRCVTPLPPTVGKTHMCVDGSITRISMVAEERLLPILFFNPAYPPLPHDF